MLVEDHMLFREGLKQALRQFQDLKVVAEAENTSSALQDIQKSKIDVVLMDIDLNGESGVTACKQILQKNQNTKIFILSASANEKTIQEAMQAGASGYAIKTIRSQQLHDAIWDIYSGKQYFDSTVASKVVQKLTTPSIGHWNQLTKQEQCIVQLVAKGMANKEIALQLKLSEATVRNYLHNVFIKFGFNNRTQISAFYFRESQNQAKPLI
jgi:DNA-binding NarL/FixJ family response regulator